MWTRSRARAASVNAARASAGIGNLHPDILGRITNRMDPQSLARLGATSLSMHEATEQPMRQAENRWSGAMDRVQEAKVAMMLKVLRPTMTVMRAMRGHEGDLDTFRRVCELVQRQQHGDLRISYEEHFADVQTLTIALSMGDVTLAVDMSSEGSEAALTLSVRKLREYDYEWVQVGEWDVSLVDVIRYILLCHQQNPKSWDAAAKEAFRRLLSRRQ